MLINVKYANGQNPAASWPSEEAASHISCHHYA
jgi:hypothetical protein